MCFNGDWNSFLDEPDSPSLLAGGGSARVQGFALAEVVPQPNPDPELRAPLPSPPLSPLSPSSPRTGLSMQSVEQQEDGAEADHRAQDEGVPSFPQVDSLDKIVDGGEPVSERPVLGNRFHHQTHAHPHKLHTHPW